MGFYQHEETSRLQVTLKELEVARRQIWTIAPGDVVPDVRAKPERETVMASRGIALSIFPPSTWRELFSKNGIYKVVQSETSVKLFQLRGKSFLSCASHHHSSALSAMAISSDGYYVALADEAYTLCIWDWRQRSLERLPWKYPQGLHQLIFCDEHSLLTVSEKNIIGCWDCHEEKARYLLPDNCPVNSLEMHPDGRSFLTISDDTLVRVWSCEKGERLSVLSHLAQVQRALFSPTGRYIITMSSDFIVHVWETTTGRPLAELEHNGEIYHLALSADENYIATASRDQHIRIWRWTSEALFEEARYHMTRNRALVRSWGSLPA